LTDRQRLRAGSDQVSDEARVGGLLFMIMTKKDDSISD
jgi:hypothetical protein